MNIPIYRAKKIDSDVYITGYLYKNGDFVTVHNIRIDPPTLAIHFPDILDSQGNKIFASLSEDGKGGDIISSGDFKETVIFEKTKINESYQGGCDEVIFYGVKIGSYVTNIKHFKVIGIQQ